MITLDCLGDICPIPAMRLQKQLQSSHPGDSILLISDHSCVPRSIGEYCQKRRLDCQTVEIMPGVWEITITLPMP